MKIIVDFETTSLKCRTPIQVGIIVCDDELNLIREFESLISLPKRHEWSEHAEAVHGIKKEKLKGQPTQEEVALMVTGLFKLYQSDIHTNYICYHAQGKFDWEILMNLLMAGDCTRGLPPKVQPYNTLQEARKLKLFDSYKLTEISKVLNFEYEAHQALSDCRATLRLMKEIKSYE